MSATDGAGPAAAAAEVVRLERLCDQVLAGLGAGAGIEAQVIATASRWGLTRFANSGIHQHVGEHTVTVSLQAAFDGRVAAASTSRTDDAGLYELVQRVEGAAAVRPVDPEWPGVTPPTDVADVDHADPATHEPAPAARAAHVEAFVAAGESTRAAGYVDAAGTRTVFANSAGHHATGSWTRATIDGIHQTTTSAGKGHQTSRRLGALDGGATGRRAARLAADSADAGDLEPGRYAVVLSPECVATIAQFLAFYGFNAKAHLEGQSFVELGEQQFDEAFQLWDAALDDRALGLGFDAEGSPKRRLQLVTDGVTGNLAHDRRTAGRAGTQTTGHAIAGGEVYGPVPTNLFVGAGDAPDVGALVAQVDRGLLVTELNYCRVLDPRTQVVTGLTRNGTFLIERGEVTRPVTNLRFTQSFVEGLGPGRLLAATADTRFADGEFGPGMVHCPAVRLASWNITGGARG
ncbi:MAG: TldD/PmbA family protein [Actinobacteria bacterium]|nr:TldD/PmbA family protein [Actinomycetota bacterium]